MKRKERVILSMQAIISSGFLASPVGATGFRLPDQDAFAVARGEAFAATADNPSAVYYNPAGITQLVGHNLRIGFYGLDMETSFRSPSGRDFENKRGRHAIPQFFYTFTPEKLSLSFGLGAFAPFGLSSRWPDDTGFRTVATQGSIRYFTINPAVAWKIRPNLSIAAGITFNRASIDLQQGLVWPAQPFDSFQFAGDGWDTGFNLGALWKPHEKVSLGVSYRSETTVDLDGKTAYQNAVAVPPVPPLFPGIPAFSEQQVDAHTRFPFPSKLIVGISFRPTPDWNLEFNTDYTDWSRLDRVKIRQERAFHPLIPQDVPIELNWNSSLYYEFGATRYMRNGWSVSAGYIYNENSVPDDNYSPLVGDLNRHFLSIGTGYKGQDINFDIAYQYGNGRKRSVSGSAPSQAGQIADGDYRFESHALAASFGWHF